MADVVPVDLNGTTSVPTTQLLQYNGGTATNQFCADNKSNFSVTAAKVNSWLGAAQAGVWYGTPANGNNGGNPWDSLSISPLEAVGSDDLQVTFYNRKAYGGSVVGTKIDLGSDYANIQALTLVADFSKLTSNSADMTLNLVYQKAGETDWSIISVEGTDTDWVTAQTQSLSIDLSEDVLGSQYVYLVASAREGTAGGEKSVIFSLNADYRTASIPEPATATLSLLALAGLASRRRRK